MISEQREPEFADHFSKVASHYSLFRPHYPDALFRLLAGHCASRSAAWDCATGNGQAAMGLAPHFEKVIATDASDKQIRSASSHSGITYRVAPAHQSGLPDRSVELVTVAQAFHWFDPGPFYREVDRVLRSGGVVAVWCYGTMQFGEEAIDAKLDHFYREVVGPFWPPERKLIEESYRTIPFPFPEIPSPQFMMEGTFTLDSLGGYLRTWSATQNYIREKGNDPVDELVKDLGEFWGEQQVRSPKLWPISMRVGRRNED